MEISVLLEIIDSLDSTFSVFDKGFEGGSSEVRQPSDVKGPTEIANGGLSSEFMDIFQHFFFSN